MQFTLIIAFTLTTYLFSTSVGGPVCFGHWTGKVKLIASIQEGHPFRQYLPLGTGLGLLPSA